MLQKLGKGAKSGIIKAVLMGFLVSAVLGLVLADFSGIVTQGLGRAQTVVEVGRTVVPMRSFERSFRMQIQNMRQALGGHQSDREIGELLIERGVHNVLIDQLLNEAMVAEYARDLGLAFGDPTIASIIETDPQFQGPGGRFSVSNFEFTLRRTGFTENEYFAATERRLAQTLLSQGLMAAVAVPPAAVEAIARHEGERRVAEVIRLPFDEVTLETPPSEEDLVAFHADNSARFRSPEYRHVRYAALGQADVAAEIPVTDAEIAGYYDQFIADFTTPERRFVEMVLADDEATAEAVSQAAAGAENLEAAIAEAAPDLFVVDFGEVERNSLDANLTDAIFGLAEVGGVTGALESPLGWHVFRLTDLRPEERQELGAVRDQIDARLRQERADEVLFDRLNDFTDAVAGADTLKEAAEAAGIAIVDLPAVARDGTVPGGDQAEIGAFASELLDTAFTLEVGELSRVVETGTGHFFAATVVEVLAPQTLTLDEVRAEVEAGARAAQQRSIAAAQAEAIAQRLAGPVDIEAVADEFGGSFEITQPFNRSGEPAGTLPPGLVNQLFEAERPGEVVHGPDGTAQVVARLVDVQPIADDDPLIDAVTARLSNGMALDVARAFVEAVGSRYSATVRREAAARLYDGSLYFQNR